MSYSKSWESFPIENNEIWSESKTNSKICACDITKNVPNYVFSSTMIYSDPPWNLSNMNMFLSKGGFDYINSEKLFYEALFSTIKKINPRVCYLEIGKKNLGLFVIELQKLYKNVKSWNIKYYKKYDCYLVRGGHNEQKFDFAGIDDTLTPELAIENENEDFVCDLCCGRGLTGVAANKLGKTFYGTELIKRKLAVFIEKSYKKGFIYQKCPAN